MAAAYTRIRPGAPQSAGPRLAFYTGDGRVGSETGCICVLITSSDDVLL